MKSEIEELSAHGLTILSSSLVAEMADIWIYLHGKTMHLGGHVERYASGKTVMTEEFLNNKTAYYEHGLACYEYSVSVLCPHLVPFALRQMDLLEAYLGTEPVMYSVNVWWAFPGGPTSGETQSWHRDGDDSKFVTMFFYLTNVLNESSAHYYKTGSHEGSDGLSTPILGPAGTVFVEDGRGFHMGAKPSSAPRLAAWVRFGVSEKPHAYQTDGNFPVASEMMLSEKERRVCRLVIC